MLGTVQMWMLTVESFVTGIVTIIYKTKVYIPDKKNHNKYFHWKDLNREYSITGRDFSRLEIYKGLMKCVLNKSSYKHINEKLLNYLKQNIVSL